MSISLKDRQKLGYECSGKISASLSMAVTIFAETTLMVCCFIPSEVVHMFYSILHKPSPYLCETHLVSLELLHPNGNRGQNF